MRARVACLIPSMSSWAALTAMSHSEMVLYSAVQGIAVKSLNQQCSLVTAARNNLVRMALKFDPQPTHIMWVDSDVVFPPETIERLLGHDKDVVGAFYNKRVPPYDTVGHLIGRPHVAKGGLYQADVMPHGCVLIKREVYEKLPQPWYFESFDPSFVTDDDPCGMIGEDVNFSRECVKAGIEMWCDADLTFAVGHIGEQVVGCTPPEQSLPRDKAAKTVATFYDGGEPSFGHSRGGSIHPAP